MLRAAVVRVAAVKNVEFSGSNTKHTKSQSARAESSSSLKAQPAPGRATARSPLLPRPHAAAGEGINKAQKGEEEAPTYNSRGWYPRGYLKTTGCADCGMHPHRPSTILLGLDARRGGLRLRGFEGQNMLGGLIFRPAAQRNTTRPSHLCVVDKESMLLHEGQVYSSAPVLWDPG